MTERIYVLWNSSKILVSGRLRRASTYPCAEIFVFQNHFMILQLKKLWTIKVTNVNGFKCELECLQLPERYQHPFHAGFAMLLQIPYLVPPSPEIIMHQKSETSSFYKLYINF